MSVNRRVLHALDHDLGRDSSGVLNWGPDPFLWVDGVDFSQIPVGSGPVSMAQQATKRAVDLVAAVALLILSSPLLLIVALAVKFSSPGPVLFRQKRIGGSVTKQEGGHVWRLTAFTMLKFRTMDHGGDDTAHRNLIHAYLLGDHGGARQLGAPEGTFKLTADRRITPLGRVLRRWSIDELPQLINVLRGEMSLVGPRPALQYEVREYQPHHMLRFGAKPGMTGLWQVMGRSALPFEEMVRLDRQYCESQSLTLDLRILMKTIAVVITGRGAG